MTRIIVATDVPIEIPVWVCDFTSFHRWVHSKEFPESGRICYINNEIWVDPSMEELFSHNQVRQELGRVLGNLMKQMKAGRYIQEGMRYSHPETDLSTEPDGMLVLHEALAEGRVRFVGGQVENKTEVVGSPEIAIEIVSRTSVEKDYDWAMHAYYDAGILEYWLINARDENDLVFDIYRRAKNEYRATRKQQGWVKSAVLGKAFRLTRIEDASGNPEFTLEVR